MQTARESPGDYGSQFSGIPMAFEVVAYNEDEDYYTITPSFRPQGQFAGMSGQEQFFIEKEGVIAHRQVLSLPVASRGRRFPVIPLVIGLLVAGVVAVIGVVMVGSGSLTPVPPTPTPTPTPAPIPQIIKSGTTAGGYDKYVGFLSWDYTVAATIPVVNAGAPGVIEAIATVRWDGESKTMSDKALMRAGEEREFVFEFQEVGSDDKWTLNTDARVVR